MKDLSLTAVHGITTFEVIENGAIIFILVLALVMFFRSSSPFNRYFIPITCIVAAGLRIVHWAQHGDEPAFMTPLVSFVATLLS